LTLKKDLPQLHEPAKASEAEVNESDASASFTTFSSLTFLRRTKWYEGVLHTVAKSALKNRVICLRCPWVRQWASAENNNMDVVLWEKLDPHLKANRDRFASTVLRFSP
jgi:hypothetical protein